MIVRLSISLVLIVPFYFSFVQTCPCLAQHLSLFAKNEEGFSTKEGLKEVPSSAIEEYEKEKLAKLKRNIDRRLLTVKTINPAEFYESPLHPELVSIRFIF
jgi:hypothetical protein